MSGSFNSNYNDVITDYQCERPEEYNFATDIIDAWADKNPDNRALFWIDDEGNEKARTFAEVSSNSRKLCNALRAAGVERGETVIVILAREIEWWEVFTAVLRLGAVISPGTTQLSSKDIEYRLQAASATCVVTNQANAEKIEAAESSCPSLKAKLVVDADRDGWLNYETCLRDYDDNFAPVATRGDEDSMCYFTSGTTGYPKMTIHTHNYAMGHIPTGRYWLDLTEDDLHWNISDTGWAKAAWSSYFGPWLCGATLFVHNGAAFNAQQTLEILQKYPVTTMCGAPTIYRMLVLEDLQRYSFTSLRHCVGAGEPLNPEIIDIWKAATGITIRDGYGQTETGILCGSFPGIEPRFGSMGKPSPGIKLAVIDDEGNEVGPNQEGDIAVQIEPEKPQGVFKEYKNDPERTADTRRGPWYITGDRAYQDEDGYFWFVSRADDVILSAGYRIGPFEVESALIEHDAVAESAVVSSPDETRGEIVKAFVVLAPGFTASDDLAKQLQDHVKQITAPYKYPRKLEFVEALPKTVSGKIRRIELREKEWST
ncbi:MAG: AMP-binding protein [Pseudomonadales bacterium]|nr:AMP-binding protein [Pseudomonadales bacterium]